MKRNDYTLHIAYYRLRIMHYRTDTMNLWLPKNREELKKHLSDPLFKNAYFLMFSSLTSAGSGFFWVIAARFYSTANIGLASAIISAMGLISMLSLLGFDISLVRFLPECSSVEALNDLDVKVDCVIVAVAHDEFKNKSFLSTGSFFSNFKKV